MSRQVGYVSCIVSIDIIREELHCISETSSGVLLLRVRYRRFGICVRVVIVNIIVV